MRGLIICGLGPIGTRVASLAVHAPGVLALVDLHAPARDHAVENEPALGDVSFYTSLAGALRDHPGAVVCLTTSSEFRAIAPDLRTACAARSPVVTTCEEAAWPFARHLDLSQELHILARDAGVAIVGLGINPGFLMDFLPAVVATPYPTPHRILVERRVDVSTRRLPLQQKVGVGLTVEEFEERKLGSGIGHRGLEESLHLLGAALGQAWDAVEVDVEPVVTDTDLRAGDRVLRAGSVIGMRNHGSASLGGDVRVHLDLVMAYGEPQPVDRIELEGPAPLPAVIEARGGVAGDEGTARVLLAALPSLLRTPPGLRTVLDLPGGLRGHWGV